MDYWLIPNNYQCNCNSQNPTLYRFYYDAITEINWSGECVDGKCAGSFTIDIIVEGPRLTANVPVPAGKCITRIDAVPTGPGVHWDVSCSENGQCPSGTETVTGMTWVPIYMDCDIS